MEEAYAELYREFLHLRSICMKQAALLGQLMETVKRLQGMHMDATMPNLNQCSEKEHKSAPNGPSVQANKLLPAAARNINVAKRGSDNNTCHLADSLNRLQLHAARAPDNRETKGHRVDGQDPFVPFGANRVSPGGLVDLLRAEQHLRQEHRAMGGMNDLGAVGNHATAQDRKLPLPTQGPWMNSSFLNSEMLSQAGGFLMSEAALHSQVCEFCHAVFPGSSTTMGEFLRHLNTHIT
ncbi:uncharacterized protein LOC108918438 [Scleropages formosus]|uniref:uncharacterized protein LOC108918438 n=1 Tax=Scleropages formosus TaxID=113540 RepID=UPI0008791D4B|nr:uncharacterized protein LOC108918438 [Scleropages formosus]